MYISLTSRVSSAVLLRCAAVLCCACFQVFSQYREQGVLMWRGFTPLNMANQVRSRQEQENRLPSISRFRAVGEDSKRET